MIAYVCGVVFGFAAWYGVVMLCFRALDARRRRRYRWRESAPREAAPKHRHAAKLLRFVEVHRLTLELVAWLRDMDVRVDAVSLQVVPAWEIGVLVRSARDADLVPPLWHGLPVSCHSAGEVQPHE